MPTSKVLSQFKDRVVHDWLPAFCQDARRRFPMEGFRGSSIAVSEEDARDCMYAIDQGLVADEGGGRYRAHRNTAFEQLFWTGSRSVAPRPLTLWVEPVITFAALARLNRDYGWPSELLGTQPKSWAFDLAAHTPMDRSRYRILCEVKKTIKEAEALVSDLLSLSCGEGGDEIRLNSRKKWNALLVAKPPILWVVGPGGHSKVFGVAYNAADEAKLEVSRDNELSFKSA